MFGSTLHLITFMTKDQLRSSFMKIQQSRALSVCLKVTTQPLLLMVKQELVRHIQWRALSTILVIHREVSFLDQWKKYSNSFKCNQVKIQRLWSELVISKFTMKSYQICSKSKEHLYRLERTRKRVSLLKDSANGL